MGLEERPEPREGGAGARPVRRVRRPSTVAAGHSRDAASGLPSRGRARDRRAAASARPRASRLGRSLGGSWARERRARRTDAATRSDRAPPRPAPQGPIGPAPQPGPPANQTAVPVPPGPEAPPRAGAASQWEAEAGPPVRAARARPAPSEKSRPNPSGPLLRTRRRYRRRRRRRLLPPGSGVLSQPESPVLRPGSGERAR